MKLRVVLLAGTVLLSGCSLNSGSAGSSATPTPRSSAQSTSVTSTPTPIPTAKISIAKGKSAYDTATAYLHKQDYARARAAFQQAVDRHERTAEAYEGMGTAAYYQHDYVGAEKAFKKAVTLSKKNDSALYYTAYAALFANDTKTAMTYITRYLIRHPTNVGAYHLRLLVEGKTQDRKGQLRDAQEIVRLRPNDPEAYNDLGIALANNSKPKQARVAFNRAASLKPNDYRFPKNLAIVDAMEKNLKAELHDLQRALALAPAGADKALLRKEIGNVKKKLGKS